MKGLSEAQRRAVEVLRKDGMRDTVIERVLRLESGALEPDGDPPTYIRASYQLLAVRTESIPDELPEGGIRLLHAICGLTSELSELIEALDSDDRINLLEEAGDWTWYIAVFCDAAGLAMDQLIDQSDSQEFDYDDAQDLVQHHLVWNLGNLTDLTKKYVYYGKTIDLQKASNHLVKILAALRLLIPTEWSLDEAMVRNIDKLKARYPAGFAESDALVRNLDVERVALGGSA
jgi:phosphoribosyl-ATP pyrophosphohydrolase